MQPQIIKQMNSEMQASSGPVIGTADQTAVKTPGEQPVSPLCMHEHHACMQRITDERFKLHAPNNPNPQPAAVSENAPGLGNLVQAPTTRQDLELATGRCRLLPSMLHGFHCPLLFPSLWRATVQS